MQGTPALAMVLSFVAAGCVAEPASQPAKAANPWASVRVLEVPLLEITVHGQDGPHSAVVRDLRYQLARDGAPAQFALSLEAAGTTRRFGSDGARFWLRKPGFESYLSESTAEGAADIRLLRHATTLLQSLIQADFASVSYPAEFLSEDAEGRPTTVSATVTGRTSDLTTTNAPSGHGGAPPSLRFARRVEVLVNDSPWITIVVARPQNGRAFTIR